MSAPKREEKTFEAAHLDTIVTRARRERDAHLRKILGSLFGR